jgi:hypothetical protein
MKTLTGMKTTILLSTILFCFTIRLKGQEYPILEIGHAAPDILLPGVEGKDYSLGILRTVNSW